MSSHIETVERHIATLESMLTSEKSFESRRREIDLSFPHQMGKLLCVLLDEGNTTFKHSDEWDLRAQALSKQLAIQQQELADKCLADVERMVRDGIVFDRRFLPILPVVTLEFDPYHKQLEDILVCGAIFWAYIYHEIGCEANHLPYYWRWHLYVLDMFLEMIRKPLVRVRRVIELPGDNKETKWEHRLVEAVRVQIEACHHLRATLEQKPKRPRTKVTTRETKGETTVACGLLSIYTNGLSDTLFRQAVSVWQNIGLKTPQKLEKIDALMPIPANVSAAKLGKAFGVSKTAIQDTPWYIQNRKGQRENEIGRRREKHHDRRIQHEPDFVIDDEQ